MAKEDNLTLRREAEKDVWKDIPGYEGLYEASNRGAIRRVGGYKSHLSPIHYGARKNIVQLHKDGKQYAHNAGDLIALTFLGEKPDCMEVLFRDGDVTNCNISNLSYANLAEVDFQMLDHEEWRWVVGYEGIYAVSKHGEIRSMARRAGPRIIKGSILRQATIRTYQTVTLCKGGVCNRRLVHRLVAKAFIPNPNNLQQINHKDEDKRNNAADNLEWCDAYYNAHYGSKITRCASANSFPVVVLKADGSFYAEFPSCTSAASHFGTRSAMVCRWINGTRKNRDGMIFKYKFPQGKKPKNYGNLQKTA